MAFLISSFLKIQFLGIIETPVSKKLSNPRAHMDRDIFFVFLAPPGPPRVTGLW